MTTLPAWALLIKCRSIKGGFVHGCVAESEVENTGVYPPCIEKQFFIEKEVDELVFSYPAPTNDHIHEGLILSSTPFCLYRFSVVLSAMIHVHHY